jgi:ribonucleoside-diphosphate reductase alpha chain
LIFLSGKRKGAFAVYIEPWHADIASFLDLKKTVGVPEIKKAKDLFYGLWIPDLFMHRAFKKEMWSLFSPSACPELTHLHGRAFEKKYLECESNPNIPKTRVNAYDLLEKIASTQINTGTPYMMYKDACNAKSNQKHLGTIRSSNLCTEIVEYTCKDEIAVCNLASISLPSCCVYDESSQKYFFDHEKLRRIAYQLTINLNRVIDITKYPLPETKKSNLRHRPIGIGVQGLAYVFMLLRLPYGSKESRKLNREIFETVYYAAAKSSCDLAKKFGPYGTFAGSPASQGLLAYDLWIDDYSDYVKSKPAILSGRWDFESLKKEIVEHGMRNSLLIAPMPTVSTSQIMNNTESFEPISSNILTKRILSGEYLSVNKYLIEDLCKLGLWSKNMEYKIIQNEGSIADIDSIPKEIKNLYKTIWEIEPRVCFGQSISYIKNTIDTIDDDVGSSTVYRPIAIFQSL